MRVLILGMDGYLGWPLALRLANQGHTVSGMDTGFRRNAVKNIGSDSLIPIASPQSRICRVLTTFDDYFGTWWDGDVTEYTQLLEMMKVTEPDTIIHFAEQPSAPYSMASLDSAWDTMQNNIRGTLNVLYAMHEVAAEAHLIKLGCYDNQTEVLTEDGWKHFKDLEYYDKVCCFDLENDSIIYHEPQQIVEYDYTGPMLHLKTVSLDALITPNHRVVHKRRSNSVYHQAIIEHADQLDKYMSIFIPRSGQWNGEEIARVRIDDQSYDMDDWLRFFGLYLSDGYVGKSHGRPCYICLKAKNPYKLNVARQVYQVFGGLKEYTDHDHTVIRVYNPIVAKHLTIYGKAATKFVPKELKALSSRQLKILYESFMDGDGTRRDRSDRYDTISWRLADDIQEIALKIGKAATIGNNSYYKRLTISDKTINRVAKENRRWEHYSGTVHCCTVPTGIIMVRRNGRMMWSGNTMGEYGTPDCDLPEGFIPENCLGNHWDNWEIGKIAECPMAGLPFPVSPGSWYHATKCHDSINLRFASKIWGLRCTDIMQGVVYGSSTKETRMHPDLATRFDYDQYFGTVINRFCAQAVIGHPLTVYGAGTQKRSFLPIEDSMQAITLLAENPPELGEYRVVNQFSEIFSINRLTELVLQCSNNLGLIPSCKSTLSNPRVEAERHRYQTQNKKLRDLGYVVTGDPWAVITQILQDILPHKDRIRKEVIMPTTNWRD